MNKFKKGNFVKTIEDPTLKYRLGHPATKFGHYGIVMNSGEASLYPVPSTPDVFLRQYLVYLQDGRKHWYWSTELIKASK